MVGRATASGSTARRSVISTRAARARRSLRLRESAKEGAQYAYVHDPYLDPDVDLKVHVNAYDAGELEAFIASHGFRVERIIDRRSGGSPELVIGHPHWWTFFHAVRI